MLICRQLAWLGLAIVALGQASCVVSEHPLSDPDKATIDNKIVGRWRQSEDEKFIVVSSCKEIKEAPAGLLQLHFIRGSESVGYNYVTCTQIGKERFFQVAIPVPRDPTAPLKQWQKSEIGGYMIFKYTVVDELWTIWSMDQDAVAELIDDDKLMGTVRATRYGPEVTLKESSEGLRKYLERRGGKELFSDKKKVVYERVKM